MDNLDDELSKQVGKDIDGRYRITGVLGRGGMGMVFRANQTSIDREVALKVLRPIFSRDPTAVKRFFREAKLASRINHPNTVTIFDFARSEAGLLYISMEYVEGQPLDALLEQEGRLSVERTLGIVSYVTDSLGDAHQNELVHRDLKPSNIIIQQRFGQPDFARVLDFGIAKTLDAGSGQETLTAMGMVCGTPAYMSPEQTMGSVVDGRSDIFALGCILYELTTGRRAFTGSSPMEVMASRHAKDFHSILRDQPPPNCPPEILQLLKDMTCKDVTKRLSALQLRQRLSDLGYGHSTKARSQTDQPAAPNGTDADSEDFPRDHAFGPTMGAVDTADTQLEQSVQASQLMETSPTAGTSAETQPPRSRYRMMGLGAILLALILTGWWFGGDSPDEASSGHGLVEMSGAWSAGGSPAVVEAPTTTDHARTAATHEVANTASRKDGQGVLPLLDRLEPSDGVKRLAGLRDGTRVAVLAKDFGPNKGWWHVRVATSRATGLVGYVQHQWLRAVPEVEPRPHVEHGTRSARRALNTEPDSEGKAGVTRTQKPKRKATRTKSRKPPRQRRSKAPAGTTPDGDEFF